MTTSNKFFMAIGVKTCLYLGAVLGTLGIYFIVTAGDYTGEKLIYVLIDAVISVTVCLSIALVFIRKMIQRILSDVEDQSQDASNTKEQILKFPFIVAAVFLTATTILVGLAIFVLNIQLNLTIINIVPWLMIFPMFFVMIFNISFFITENAMAKLLKNERIRNAIPNKKIIGPCRSISKFSRWRFRS